MKYYVFDVCWSQTDHDSVIVAAYNLAEAENIIRAMYERTHFYLVREATMVN